MTIIDLPGAKPEGQARALRWMVTSEYREALGLRLTRGRFLEPGDATAPTTAIVVNEEFVRRFLNDGHPVIGRQWIARKSDKRLTEIVGVVANVLKGGLDREPQPEVFQSMNAGVSSYVSLVIRTTSNPTALAPEVRRLVRELDPGAALLKMNSLSNKLSASVAQPRFATWLLTLFASVALAVAATGLYGFLSYSVAERRREMGVRTALGATRGSLLRLVLRQGLGFTVAGLLLGLLTASVSSRLLSALLFGTAPHDVVAFTAAPAVLLLVALAACLGPAWLAATTNPVEILREE